MAVDGRSFYANKEKKKEKKKEEEGEGEGEDEEEGEGEESTSSSLLVCKRVYPPTPVWLTLMPLYTVNPIEVEVVIRRA